ncbi:MAG: FtsH protease activity modulator HflK [Spirochaetia bacterium]|jgi:membrane protease subunit HflK|nr:FtsH protease activity modulator HflK [Spirochaetales bacterium]MDX9784054.1 FtsH protease activity modulator HflK [Spirochaetia bacterium]
MPETVIRPKAKFKIPDIKLKGPIILIIVLAVAIITVLSTSFIIVDQTESAVITTFGRYSKTVGAGLHYKLPFGIQKSYIVPTKVIQTETFGFRTLKTGFQTQYSEQQYPDESTMLTGDLNIVDVEWIIQYRIDDPQAWLFNVFDKQKTIRDISQSVMNRLVGDRLILGVIGSDRQTIQDNAVVMMNDIFDQYGLGIKVTQVQLQNIVPPAGVQNAFEDVNKAIQDMNRLINEGKEAYNAEIPKAKGQADQLVEIAQGYAAERVNEAKGDVARFESVLTEYRKSPDITRKRLYFEMIDEILAGNSEVELIDKTLENVIPLKMLGGAQE